MRPLMLSALAGILTLAAASQAAAPVPAAKPPAPVVAKVASPSPAPSLPEAKGVDPGLLALRDPFKKPSLQKILVAEKTELELIEVEKLKLQAVVTGPKETRAMISGPTGNIYFVRKGMKIGLRQGVVAEITPFVVVVREQSMNPYGGIDYTDSEIRMAPEVTKGGGLKGARIGAAK